MKMRDLEKQTGVHRETIRTYFRYNLIPEPHRPKPNVADYDETHVSAIKTIRDIQKTSGMTLKEIKASMNGQIGSQSIRVSTFRQLESLVSTRMGIDTAPVLLSKLANALPNAESDAKRFASVGLLDIIKTHDGPALSLGDARMVSIWSEMRQAGFTEELGFTPEMLTFYLQPAEMAADSEATLFLERVQGKISEEKAAEMLQVGLRVMLDFYGLIRMKLFLKNIAQDTNANLKP